MDRKALLLSLLLVIAAVLTACAGGGDPGADGSPPATATAPDATDPTDESPETPGASPIDETPSIEVRDGQVQGDVPTIEAGVGETVRFRVIADVADEVHVHGFDHHVDVVPGEETLVEFEAGFAGQFEVELEEAGLLIAELVIR